MPIDRKTLNHCYEILAQAGKSSEQKLEEIHKIMFTAIPNLTLEQVIPELFSNTNTSLFEVKLSESATLKDKENQEYDMLKALDEEIGRLEKEKVEIEKLLILFARKKNDALEELTLHYRILNECYKIRKSQDSDAEKKTKIAEKIEEIKSAFAKTSIINKDQNYFVALAVECQNLKNSIESLQISYKGDFKHKGLKEFEEKVVEQEKRKEEATTEADPVIKEYNGKLRVKLQELGAVKQKLKEGLEREDAIKKQKKDQQTAESIALRKSALEGFFADERNFEYLDKQDKNGKIPILIILGFEKVYNKDFVLRILRNTKDVASYKYYDKHTNGDSQATSFVSDVDDDRVSLGSSIRAADWEEGQSLLDYLVRQQAGEANSGEIATEMLKMGIPLNFKFEPVERGKPPKKNPVLNKLLESRSLKWGLAKAICLYFLKEKHDLSLFFDLLRYEEARSGSISSTAASYAATPRRGSQLGSRSASFSYDNSFSTSASSPYGARNSSFDLAVPETTVPAMAEEEGTIDNFVYDVINEILNDKSEEVAVDIIRDEEKDTTRKHQNIASFLLRKFLFHDKPKEGSKKREEEGRFIKSIWTELQSDANLKRIPIKMFSVPDREGNTFLHYIALLANSNVINALMYRVVQEYGQEKWEEIISITNHAGETPLDLACSIGFDGGIQQLSLPRLFGEDFTGEAEKKDRELAPLAKVAREGKLVSCEILLRFGAANFEYSNLASIHPVALAIKNNHESVVESLLQYGFDPNQEIFVAGKTIIVDGRAVDTSRTVSLLEYAKNNFKATVFLIRYGADIDKDFAKSFSNPSQAEEIERARREYLEQRESIDEAIAQRKALCPLIYEQFIEARKYIAEMYKLGCGKDVIAKAKEIQEALAKAKDPNKITELMTELKNIPSKKILTLRAFFIEMYEKFKDNPGLHHKKINEALVELLKSVDVTDIAIKRASEFFASLSDVKDEEGKTFLHHLAVFKDSALLSATIQKVIIDKGKEKWEEIATTQDNTRQLALHEACRVGFHDGVKYLIADPKFFRAQNADTDVPLRIAIKQGDVNTCINLLQFGASVDYPMFAQLHPMALVLDQNRNNILKLLLQYGFDPNQAIIITKGTEQEPDYEKVSLLKYAIDNFNDDAVLILIKYGADIEDEAYKKYKASQTSVNQKELEEVEQDRQTNSEDRDADVKMRQTLSYERFKAFREIKYYECQLKARGFKGKKIAQLQEKVLESASIEEMQEHYSLARKIPSPELNIMAELYEIIEKKFAHRFTKGSDEFYEPASKEFSTLRTAIFNFDKDENEKFKAIEKFFTSFAKKIEEDLARAKTVAVLVEKSEDRSVKEAKESEKAAKLARMQAEIDILKSAKALSLVSRGHPDNESRMRAELNRIQHLELPKLAPYVAQKSPAKKDSSAFSVVGSFPLEGAHMPPSGRGSNPSQTMAPRGAVDDYARPLAGASAGYSRGGDAARTDASGE